MFYTQIVQKQILKSDLQTVWNFISSPNNLEKITPDDMSFKITSKNIIDSMYPGMIITYKVTPLLKIPLTWVTEITHVKEKNFFVDEQKIGPYKLWHHQHILKEVEEGVLMIDIITYQPPLGFIGALLNFLFIRKKVKHIFKFRYNILEKLFNKV
tara:strand:+ start:790 stop:1254 length:465 start_codon:yes stop_codon:yes gene_type:complete